VRAALEGLALLPATRPSGENFFLPVDRVFTVRGFGVVATGTLRGGALRGGDRVAILPGGGSASVRRLERHNREVTEARPGQRVAVNLRGIERSAIERGAVIAAPGLMSESLRLDVDLQLLEDAPRPLANGGRVRVLTGTSEVLARVRLLDRAELAPGMSSLAQLRLEEGVATHAGEYYIVRAYSPMRTIGGGRILDAHAARHRRFDANVLQRLASLAAGDTERVLADWLESAGVAGIDCAATAAKLELPLAGLQAQLFQLHAHLVGERAFAESSWTALGTQILARLGEFHTAHPRERGIDSDTLHRQIAATADAVLWRNSVAALIEDGHIEHANGVVFLRGFDPLARVTDAERALLGELETAFRRAGLEPPAPAAVVSRDRRATGLYQLLLEHGRLIRLSTYARGTQIVLHADTLARVQRQLADRYPHPQRFSVAEARDLLQSTRKHITPVMEHLDATGFTIRVGDLRQVRAS
jgi:selenocysteine-specific elongation factor